MDRRSGRPGPVNPQSAGRMAAVESGLRSLPARVITNFPTAYPIRCGCVGYDITLDQAAATHC
ncbi:MULTISPECIES: hypothetical protein [Tenebrionibacter/Tenebrionicola group]|uniref:Uncharacterized protein n=2 Tax=Tenebrionibacter/Tenebrionicola group TaxID=2969848 RepID=A0A8K0V3D2_9ENTR|nr:MULTISPECIES: hypothetical protein [Tenebrionibacter/Tenebrionicola group]MBK4714876.1 hypothetical protein [Tenebrionibacter intestinalis]MBV4414115.1 hypothetical protein [Tenebrionicola larvae]MBV5095565.1 hypothetical protein [Tenebrionicola larvae]